MVSSPQWLSRYLAGQREQVWHELRQPGSTIRQHSELAEEAQLVCDEMARRAGQNVEAIIERLSTGGYQFHANDDEQTPMTPHVAPTGRTKVTVVAETEDVLAFEHTRPFWPVHIVVVPKRHVPSLVDLGEASEGLLYRIIEVVRQVAAEVERHMAPAGC